MLSYTNDTGLSTKDDKVNPAEAWLVSRSFTRADGGLQVLLYQTLYLGQAAKHAQHTSESFQAGKHSDALSKFRGEIKRHG